MMSTPSKSHCSNRDSVPAAWAACIIRQEAHLHPLKAASGLITGLTRRGGQIAIVDAILSAHNESKRIVSLETSSGTIQAESDLL